MTKPHLGFLDTLRGVAILSVFIFHAFWCAFGSGALPWGHYTRTLHVSQSFLLCSWATLGWAGVALFFALSGFCIHLSFANNPNWLAFFRRRFWRIYPAYFIAMVAFSYVYPVDIKQIWTHTFLVHNLSAETFSGINPAFWSIAVEVQLYLIYPGIIWMVSKLTWKRTVIILAVIEFALRFSAACFDGLPQWVLSSPLDYCFSWALGAYIAELHVWELDIPRWPTAWLLVIASVSTLFKATNGFAFTIFAVAGAAWIAKGLLETHDSPNAWTRHLRFAGNVSFSAYLIHGPIIELAGYLLPHAKSSMFSHAPVRFAILLLVWFPVMGLSWVVYRYIEEPGMEIGKTTKPRLTLQNI